MGSSCKYTRISCVYKPLSVAVFIIKENISFSFILFSWHQNQYRPMPSLNPFFPCSLYFLSSLIYIFSMAVASSSQDASSVFALPNFPTSFSTKLDESNYIGCLNVIVPMLKSHDMMGIVDGSNPCPPKLIIDEQGKSGPNLDYSLWVRKDQFLLGWLNLTLSESILTTMFGLNSSNQVWNTLKTRFASESRSRVSQLKSQLQSLNQGSKSCAEYLGTAKKWADQLAAIGKPTEDEDLISFILSVLNPSYNSFVTSYTLTTRNNPLSFTDFQDELLNFEVMLNQQQHHAALDVTPFALYMQKGKHGSHHFNKKMKSSPFNWFSPRTGFSRGTPNGAPRSNFQTHEFVSGRSTQSPQHIIAPTHGLSFSTTNRAPCQICGKTSHQALDCFH
jgi:hypothetical protein